MNIPIKVIREDKEEETTTTTTLSQITSHTDLLDPGKELGKRGSVWRNTQKNSDTVGSARLYGRLGE